MSGTFLEMLGSEFEEFAILASRFLQEKEENFDRVQIEMKEVFRLYDKTRNGYITTEVLREYLEYLDDNLTAKDLNNIIEEIDADGSGTVDWDGRVKFLIVREISAANLPQSEEYSWVS
ncbi:Troponin C at 41C [Carabus blaptoides fortunei]